jgi:hypothetical protein
LVDLSPQSDALASGRSGVRPIDEDGDRHRHLAPVDQVVEHDGTR